MAGHAQLKFVMTECSKTQIRLTGLICKYVSFTILEIKYTTCIDCFKVSFLVYSGQTATLPLHCFCIMRWGGEHAG